MNKSLLLFSGILLPIYLFAQTAGEELQKKVLEKEQASFFYSEGRRMSGAKSGNPNQIMITGPEQDCNSAIPVCQNLYTQSNSYSGTGNQDEIPSNSSCLGSNEKNSVWYIFTVSAAGTIQFTITPVNSSDDYDFALYNITGSNCSGISSGAITPVRCNFSATAGATGLSPSASNPSEPASGPNTSTTLSATVGQTYVLVVSNYSSTQNGYALDFSASSASIFDNVPPAPNNVFAPCGSNSLTFNISESVLCNTIAANGSDFTLTGTGGPYSVTSAAGINCGSATPQAQVNFTPALSGGGPWTLSVQSGSDGNTLIDNCGNVMAPASVNFNTSPPSASISGDNQICLGETVGLTASNGSSWSWTGPSGFTATTQTISLTPTSAGSYTYNVTITNGTCGTASASFTLTVKGAPVANFTAAPSPACAGQVVTFTNTSTLPQSCNGLAIVTCPCSFPFSCQATNPGLGTYLWSFGDGNTHFDFSGGGVDNPTNTYSSPGTYTVSLNVTDPFSGCSNTITHDVTIQPAPSAITANNDTTICTGSSATLYVSGGGPYTWTASGGFNQTGNVITVSPTATTTYTVSSPGCGGASLTDQVTVTITNPTATVSPQITTICNGSTVSITGNTTGNWTSVPAGFTANNTSSISVSPVSNTQYILTVGSGACSDTAIAIVNVTAPPSASVSPQIVNICEGNTATFTGNASGNWTSNPAGFTASGTNSITVSPVVSTDYILTVGSGTCIDTAIAKLIVTPQPNASVSPQITYLCSGNNATITGSASGNWTSMPAGFTASNTNTITVSPGANTAYILTLTNGSCTDTAIALVSVTTTPVVTVSPQSASICEGSSVSISSSVAGDWTSSPAGYTAGNANSISDSPAATTQYIVTVTSGNCADTAIAIVNVTPQPNASVSPQITYICSGTSTTITGNIAGDWTSVPAGFSATNTASITVSPNTNTAYIVTLTNGSCSDTAIALVSVTTSPVVTVSPQSASICEGSSVSISSSVAGNWTSSPAGFTANNTNSISDSPVATTQYIVIVTSGNCADTAIAIVNVTPQPAASVSPQITYICSGTSTAITGNLAGDWASVPAGLSATNTSSITVSPNTNTAYILTLSNGNCTDTAIALVSVTATPAASVTPQLTTICPGSSATITSSSLGDWTSIPAGFTANNVNSITVSPSANIQYVLTVNSGMCSDTAIATVNVSGGNFTLQPSSTNASCGMSDGSVNVNVNPAGAYTYSWQNSGGAVVGTNASLSGLPTGTYTVTVSLNGCSKDTTAVISSPGAPVMNLMALSPVCPGDTSVIIAFGVDSITISPLTDVLGIMDSIAVIIPSQTITYSVTGFDTNNPACPAGPGPITITVNSLPQITNVVTVDPNCGNSDGSISINMSGAGPFTYDWLPNVSTSSSATNIPSDSYDIVITDNNTGCSKDTVINLNNAGGITMSLNPNNISTCEGAPVNYQINSLPAGTTFTWTPSSGIIYNSGDSASVTLNPSTTTTYNVTAHNNGCNSTDQLTVTVNPVPQINSVAITQPTCGLSNGDAALSVTGGSGNYSYQWTPNVSATNSASALSGGTYAITVNDINSNCFSDTVINLNITGGVAINPPNPNFISICNGDTTIVNISSNQSNASYLWSPNSSINYLSADSSSAELFPAVTITYLITATYNGCNDTSHITINVSSPVNASIAITDASCGMNNGSATASASGGIGPYAYFWQPGNQTSSSVSNLPAGAIGVLVLDAIGCFDTVSAIINTTPAANINVSGDTIICPGESAILTASGGVSYSWTPGNIPTASVALNPITTTTYTVTGMDGNGCQAVRNVQVVLLPKPVVSLAPSNAVICADSSIQLTASGANTYAWTPTSGLTFLNSNADSVRAQPAITTQYAAIGVSIDGCIDTAISNITVIPIPVANAGADHFICPGETVTLNGSGGGSYSWSPEELVTNPFSASPFVQPTLSTTYYLTVTVASCSAKDSVKVTIYDPPFITATGDTTINIGESHQLGVIGGTEPYSWEPSVGLSCLSCAQPMASPVENTEYIVTYTNVQGCKIRDTVLIKVVEEYALYLPNSVTPDDNNLNDKFIVFGFGIKEYTLRIFDRWGQEIFTKSFSKDDLNKEGWDTRKNGREVKQDVYTYVLEYTTTANVSGKKIGTVTVLK